MDVNEFKMDVIESYFDITNKIQRLRRSLGLAEVALERLAKLGNGENYGNSVGNIIAIDALKDIKDIKKEVEG